MSSPTYRFRCQIIDIEIDQVIEQDWCTIGDATIDDVGNCEPVDQIVGRMMRIWRDHARAEYEKGQET